MKRNPKNIATGYPGVYKKYDANKYYFVSSIKPTPFYKGKQYKEYGFNTPEEAYKAKIAYEKPFKDKLNFKNSEKRISKLVIDFLDWNKSQVKPTTLASKQSILNKHILVPYLNHTIDEFCSETNLKNLRKKIVNNKNLQIPRKNTIFKVIQELFKYGNMTRRISLDQYNKVVIVLSYIKNQNKVILNPNKTNFWSIKEWHKFLSVIDPNNKWFVFFSLLGELGCRIGEIRGFQRRHVSFVNETITIDQQATSDLGKENKIIPPKTKSSYRTISLSKEMVKLLKKFMEYQYVKDPNRFLFFNGKEPASKNAIYNAFRKFTREAKLPPIRIHDIRHSNATWLLSDKLSIQDIGLVSKRLGHSSTKETLDTYMEIHKREDDSTIKNTLDQLFYNPKKGGKND